MAYTPELTSKSAKTLRRLAWAMGVPMTEAMQQIFKVLPRILNRNDVCEYCRDKTICEACSFNEQEEQDVFSLTLVIKEKKLAVREFPIFIKRGKNQPDNIAVK